MLDVQEIVNQRVCKNPSCTNFTKRTYCSVKCANEIICKDPERNKRIGETVKGFKHTEETKLKISEVRLHNVGKVARYCKNEKCNKRLKYSQDKYCSRNCMSVCFTGRTLDENVRVKMRLSNKRINKGIPMSEEQKIKLRLNAKINPNFGTKGKKYSEATKLKMSKNHRGGVLKGSKKLPITGLKISISKYGKFHTSETKLKIKENAKVNSNFGMSGKKHSEETKLKMRNSRLLIMKSREFLLKDIRSKPEIAWGQKIENIFHVKLEHSKWIGRRCFDFCYKNFLFEIDGCYWHSLPKQAVVDQEKDKIARDSNFSLIRFPLNQKNDIDKIIFENFPILYSIFTSERLLTC